MLIPLQQLLLLHLLIFPSIPNVLSYVLFDIYIYLHTLQPTGLFLVVVLITSLTFSLLDCLEIDGSLSWRLHTKILYETYIKWCNKNNERVMSQKWLGLRMSKKGFKRLSTNEQRVCGLD